MPTLRPRILALTCLLAVFLLSAPARAQEKGENKTCDKPAVTLGSDGKTPSVDPLPEIPSPKEDHVDWPVLDRAAYQRLTVAAARLRDLVSVARFVAVDHLLRSRPLSEEYARFHAENHEYDEYLGATDMVEENLLAVHEMLRVDHSWPCAANACALAVQNARLAQRRLEESSRRMAALSRDTEESCLKARDAMIKLTPTLLRLMDEAIRPVEARACWEWAHMIYPYSRFGKRTEAGIAELTALTDALEKLKAPKNAGKTWTLTWREAVTLARTARTSLERAGRFWKIGYSSCMPSVGAVELRNKALAREKLRVAAIDLRNVEKEALAIFPKNNGELKVQLNLLIKTCKRTHGEIMLAF